MWLYAQLASTAYGDERKFALPEYVTPEMDQITLWSGFKAQAFNVAPASGAPYVVIAYAGTEGLGDWVFGNFNPLQTQGRQGLALLRRLQHKYQNRKFVLVGHSLGGAISKYAATRVPNVEAYVFNPSLMATSGPYASVENINGISQYAEVLAGVRKILPNGPGEYTTLGCYKDGPIGRHSIRVIAECLTHVAAWESAQAQASLELNRLTPRRRIDPQTHTLVL